MGDPASSAFLQFIIQTVANIIMEELRLEHGLHAEVEALGKNVKMIRLVLDEQKEPSRPLKEWMDELRDAAYDALDVLDEHQTEHQRRALVNFAKLRNVFSIVNPSRAIHRHEIAHKLQEVAKKMNEVFQKRINFGLSIHEPSSSGGNAFIETTSSLPPVYAVPREKEKRQILGLLINEDYQVREPNLSVLAIHGIGQTGKTTLTQLIYNETIIDTHFDLKLWVHVSHTFDLERVTRSIVGSLEEVPLGSMSNLDKIQRHVEKKLKGKRFLLVLDDVWQDNQREWEKMLRPLYRGRPGSKIIVTTRNTIIAEMVSTITTIHLKELSEDECFSLVCRYASRFKCIDSELDPFKSEIFIKCKGMPMAAISLGDRLRRAGGRNKREEIILQIEDENIFWAESSDFRRSVRLSYYSLLPANLKPCLAYCAIIPKGKCFEKEWVIQLWIAQGFIVKTNQDEVERVGNNYFESLLERSFFERARVNRSGNNYEYTIPNAVHDIAQLMSDEECGIIELGKLHTLTKFVRHLSIVITNDLSCHDPFTETYQYNGLHTLLVIGDPNIVQPLEVPHALVKHLLTLRTLDLTNCNLISLPETIGDLKHLRYLQLCNTKIKELPDSVSCLYNLQVLGLRNCFLLRHLPCETRCLRNLKHLDLHLDVDISVLSNNYLKSMPPEIGLLTNLQVLPRFVVTTNNHCGIIELGHLNGLHGELLISNLNLVRKAEDAAQAQLENKQHIHRLGLVWTRKEGESFPPKKMEVEKKVLENLSPNGNIKEIDIVGYGGEILPNWIGSRYLLNLQTLCLIDCKKCTKLLPLGYLPLLRDLRIEGMDSLEHVNCNTFCGTNGTPFPSLKKLSFESMRSLENWSGQENCVLHCLEELVIKGCTKLQRFSHNLPSLRKLILEETPEFLGLRRYPSLKYLEVCASGEWIWDSWPCLSSLFSLTLSQLSTEIFPSNLNELNSLRQLEISHCEKLLYIPDNWIPTNLTFLSIKHCSNLLTLPSEIKNIITLEDLEIEGCEQLECLPELKRLKSLTRLEILGCDSIVNLPSEGLPNTLHFLRISGCPLFSRQFKDVESCDRPNIAHVFSVWIDGELLPSSSIILQGESSRR